MCMMQLGNWKIQFFLHEALSDANSATITLEHVTIQCFFQGIYLNTARQSNLRRFQLLLELPGADSGHGAD